MAAHLQLLNEKVTKLQIQLTTSPPVTAQGLESPPTTTSLQADDAAADTQRLLHGLYQRIVSLEQRSYHETIGQEENKVVFPLKQTIANHQKPHFFSGSL